MRVHHQRFHGKYGSRGRSELIPNPFWICDDLFGGTRFGIDSSGVCANELHVASKPMRQQDRSVMAERLFMVMYAVYSLARGLAETGACMGGVV